MKSSFQQWVLKLLAMLTGFAMVWLMVSPAGTVVFVPGYSVQHEEFTPSRQHTIWHGDQQDNRRVET